MRFLTAAVVLATLAVPVLADPIAPPARGCAVDSRAVPAADRGLRRLDRLPLAREFLAVFRTVDRCPAPVVVRSDIGATQR